MDSLRAEIDADDAAHVLPRVANMIGVLQALYVFADRGARRPWDGTQVLALPGAGQLKDRIGDVLRSALPCSA
jgi:hypothetical protein